MGFRSHVAERAVVEALVAVLAALFTRECELLTGGAGGEVAFLTSELVSMRAFLDSASAAGDDELLRVSAEEIRKLSGDIERGVHAYNTASRAVGNEGRGSHAGGLLAFVERCARLPYAVWSRRCAAEEVLGLKVRVLEAAERRKRYRVVDVDCAGTDRRRRRIFNHSCQENKIQGDDVAATEESMAARLEWLERELQRERDESHQEREHWVKLWQSMAERLRDIQLPLPPPQQADAVVREPLVVWFSKWRRCPQADDRCSCPRR